jgi:hypothetical protein
MSGLEALEKTGTIEEQTDVETFKTFKIHRADLLEQVMAKTDIANVLPPIITER